MKIALLVAVLAILLAIAGMIARESWLSMEGVAMSTNGIIAMLLGAGVSLALGMGLMFLVFKSSRDGHDEL